MNAICDLEARLIRLAIALGNDRDVALDALYALRRLAVVEWPRRI